ncbi:MAG: hypothetical protein P4L64_06155 [Caulobacteraceae bacterium]|nr:hypothetical protein [Caulobacteraceae bacterium]
MVGFGRIVSVGGLGLAVLSAQSAAAEPTHVVVRALAKDAKFIGDSMGGVDITLTDAASGGALAHGITAGATGDTKRIVVEPRVRGQALSTPEAARFDALVDIDRPTLVRAEARGPLGKPGAQITVTSTMWLLPGKAVEGDGWVLEFPGLVVEPVWTSAAPDSLRIGAKVTLMCGCPIEPGGHWDAAQYEVKAALFQGERAMGQATLTPDGSPSHFAGALGAPKLGVYRLLVTAHNAATGNTGVAEIPLAYPPPTSLGGQVKP